MRKNLNNISPVATSHKAGLKRVLLTAEESGCAITQIAVTNLKDGEVANAHIHVDMQEGFYVLNGELDIVLDEETEHCKSEDFVWVPYCVNHELRAITDVHVMTVGCAVQ